MPDRPAPSGYEYFEVEADVGVRAWGETLAEAFGQTALGALALVVEPEGVEERELRHVRAQGDGPESLLVAWVNECLYVGEIEAFAVHRVEVATVAGGVAHGVLHGEPIAVDRHRLGTVVKAATLHGVRVTEAPDRVEIALVVDV